jgi:hypothetical protein
VVPDTGRNVYAAFMGDADRRLESCCVLRLLGGGDTHHLHVWEARSVEEVEPSRADGFAQDGYTLGSR